MHVIFFFFLQDRRYKFFSNLIEVYMSVKFSPEELNLNPCLPHLTSTYSRQGCVEIICMGC